MGLFSKKSQPAEAVAPEPAPEPELEPDAGLDDQYAPGWDAITEHFEAAYPDQTNPPHYATQVPYSIGGPDPIDGISIYRATDPIPHWHYVTYGYSDLYGEELTDDPDADSGFGIEMTLRLADPKVLDAAAEPPIWVAVLLQRLARYVFDTGRVFYATHRMDPKGPITLGLLDQDTQLTALAFTDDPIGTPIHTPCGLVRFVQAVGITRQELAYCQAWNTESVLDVIGRKWPRGITILDRPGLESDPELVALVERT